MRTTPRQPLAAERGGKRTGPLGSVIPGDLAEMAREIERLWWELRRIKRKKPTPAEEEAGGTGGGGIAADGPWIYVGSGSPAPAFQNSWSNAGGADAPVSYLISATGWVHLRGAFLGGAANTVVFTLPVGYRPAYQQEMVIPTTDPARYATIIIGTNGDVKYLQTV